MTSFHDLTNEALRRWVAATGVDPEVTSWRYQDGSISGINDQIRIAQDADPTGLTTYLYLRACARDYVAEHQHDALSLIERPAEVQERLAPLRALLEALDHPDLVDGGTAFQRQLRDMAEDQGVLAQTTAIIDDLSALGSICLDALHAAETLRRDTFARGPNRARNLRYNRRVLKFWNVNSLVRALEAQPEDGISLCLLRDPQVVEYSFFAFAMRDGDTMTMWSDVPTTSHPLQKHMSRSRSRARNLEDRMGAFRFPYQLLDATFVDEGRSVIPDTTGTALVRTNLEAVAVASLEELEPDQILWALMMFDLLRYQPDHVGELSCTGETVYLALAGTQQKALGQLEPLTRADVTAAVIDEQLKRTEGRSFSSTHTNAWMEERYVDGVDETVYNLFGTQTEGVARSGAGQTVSIRGAEDSRDLATTDPMSFGTASSMLDDRVWVARHNQAQRVQGLADAEFERRRDEIEAWFRDAVQARSEWFLEAVCRATAVVHDVPTNTTDEAFPSQLGRASVDLIQWQRFRKGECPTSYSYYTLDHVPLYTVAERVHHRRWVGNQRKNWEYLPARCFVSGESASVWTLFEPRSPDMLRALVGDARLPDVLEHWFLDVPYHGNHILDRTDPMDSMVKNPWVKLSFQVIVGLSLREFRRQCKTRGISHPEDFARRSENFEGWTLWRSPRRTTPNEEDD